MPKARTGKVFFAADVMYIFEVMLSKRLKSHAKANITRGLGKRVNVRAPLKYVPLPEDMQAVLAAESADQEAAASKLGLAGWLARTALLLALLLLPLNAFIGWQLYQEYEAEQTRAAEYAALLYDTPTSAAAQIESVPAAAHIPPGMFDWLKKQSDEVLHRLGLAVYAPAEFGGTLKNDRFSGTDGSAAIGASAIDGAGSIDRAGGAGGDSLAGSAGITEVVEVAETVEAAEGQGRERGLRRLDAVLAAALRDIFPELDGNAYYMLWEGGKVLCAPLAPEAEGLDLSLLRDSSGERFVPGFIRKAEQRGGYMFFSIEQGPLGSRYDARTGGKLDRKKGSGSSGLSAELTAEPSVEPTAESSGTTATALHSHKGDEAAPNIDILAYIAPFEDTGVYLTVWRPVIPDGYMKKNKYFFSGLFRSFYSELFIALLLIQCSLCGFFGLLRKRS